MKLLLAFIFIIEIIGFRPSIIVQNKNKYYCFDKEFAELISKPLPLPSYNKKKENSTESLNEYIHKKSLNESLNVLEDNKIILPGFFEIFPMLDWKWPVWTMKNGKRIECKKDDDCKFPQSCCNHPIIPGNKFCCTGGYKQRAMKPAYIRQEIRIY
jgi:hypothetical protein